MTLLRACVYNAPSGIIHGFAIQARVSGGLIRRCPDLDVKQCTKKGCRPCYYATAAQAEKQKRDQDRETFISVLEVAATRRDAKSYLKTFASPPDSRVSASRRDPARSLLSNGIRAVAERPQFRHGPHSEPLPDPDRLPHVAIVKFVNPESWDEDILKGLSKTIRQLRMLGLQSLVVVECGPSELQASDWRATVARQVDRIADAIGRSSRPGAHVIEGAFAMALPHPPKGRRPRIHDHGVWVALGDVVLSAVQSDFTPVFSPVAYAGTTLNCKVVGADEIVLALATYLSGLHLPLRPEQNSIGYPDPQIPKHASVDRIIVLDPLGGIPRRDLPGAVRVFINLEEEFGDITKEIADAGTGPEGSPIAPQNSHGILGEDSRRRYLGHLDLARNALATLPPSASVVITTPAEAANLGLREVGERPPTASAFVGSVGTRRKQNPLIHNLLTDRPVYSSSLPPGRIKAGTKGAGDSRITTLGTTLAKRGMPVTMFPDPRRTPWQPPEPGSPRLRLTDMCIDLPRLVHLIDDSFDRKLDVQDYLRRVESSLAGVIIAGEYEGGAILTWERPCGLDEEAAYMADRLVPYLDKFAVLKRSQGAGGVADIVFNAMVRDCFPAGVCWRSRKDNPVNRWYFERSRGTWKLADSNWAMFWTTPDVALGQQRVRDYEDVCRNVVPSWADTQRPAD